MRELGDIEEQFFQLLRVAVGNCVDAKMELSDDDWFHVYQMASEQSVLGLVLQAADALSNVGQKPPMTLLYQWIGEGEQIRQQNHRVDQQCEQLSSWFKQKGFSSCVIKGQGVARLYPQPDLRQPGDIDIWVGGKRDNIVKIMCDNFIGVTYVDYVNCHAGFFTDTEVEVHFRPTWFFNPFVNRKVQKWIKENDIGFVSAKRI